jgi:methylated-DNA-[protein]-cysteine S-methyltransferase
LVVEGTPFRVKVWRALERIPYGETVSYGQVGERVGSPGSSRAVGMACGFNPLPIVIPCHRVIGAGGKLVGFGGGLEMKKAMLEFEHQRAGASQGRLALAR